MELSTNSNILETIKESSCDSKINGFNEKFLKTKNLFTKNDKDIANNHSIKLDTKLRKELEDIGRYL